MVNPDLEPLLALQADDTRLDELEQRGRAIDARAEELDRARRALVAEIDATRAAIDTEERRERELAMKLDAHRQHQQKNLAQLDQIRKAREAAAAMAQIDIMRRALASEESEIHAIVARLRELRQNMERQEQELAAFDERQRADRARVEAERQAWREELERARAERAGTAQRLPRPLLSKYERLRGRRKSAVVFQVRDGSCGHCHVAIPMQRRNLIMSGRLIEPCEGCGMLLYSAATN